MHFGSPYVLDCEPDYESVSDEEYDGGMAVSDDESDSPVEHSVTNYIKGEDSIVCHRSRSDSPIYNTPADSSEELPPFQADVLGTSDELPKPLISCSFDQVLPPLPLPPRRLDKAPLPKKKSHHWRRIGRQADPPEKMEREEKGQPLLKGRQFRRADTNIVSIKFDHLETPSTMHAGDAVVCSQCQAILSHISQLVEDGSEKVWTCEFCGSRNLVNVEEEEVPKKDDVTFLVEPALATAASGPSGLDESLVVFCIDISGSMCVTTEVAGQIHLRGAGHLEGKMQSFIEDRSPQYLPHQNRNVTYISRLQSVQAAVDHQLEEMARNHGSRRVALITFNNEVEVIGDGTVDRHSFAGDKLNSIETLIKIGESQALPKSVKETRRQLSDKLFSLEEGGGTALGPALAVAVALASQQPGSKVILCTDGLANVGLGRLDLEDALTDFYDNIGQQSVSKGVAISVITIKGTKCKLVELGKLAEQTGGQVNIVDPLKLTQEFSTILADRILATNVEATFIVHKDLFVVNEDGQESKAIRKIGNVTKDTKITFEYSMRPRKKKSSSSSTNVSDSVSSEDKSDAVPCGDEKSDAVPCMDKKSEAAASSGSEEGAQGSSSSEMRASPAELPFQLQISYIDSEGTKALRVFTQKQPVTTDRTLAETNADLKVLGTHACQKSAQFALAGDYTRCRGTALMHQRLAWRSYNSAVDNKEQKKSLYKKVFRKIQSVENKVNLAQISELNRHGRTYSDDEGDDECDALDHRAPPLAPRARASSHGTSCKLKRSNEVDDDMALDMYEMIKD